MEKTFGLIDALKSLTPTAMWAFEEETYEALEWRDDVIAKPTKKEIEDEISRLTQEAVLAKTAEEERVAAEAAAKASALDKLAKLGLTSEEAKAVIGL